MMYLALGMVIICVAQLLLMAKDTVRLIQCLLSTTREHQDERSSIVARIAPDPDFRMLINTQAYISGALLFWWGLDFVVSEGHIGPGAFIWTVLTCFLAASSGHYAHLLHARDRRNRLLNDASIFKTENLSKAVLEVGTGFSFWLWGLRRARVADGTQTRVMYRANNNSEIDGYVLAPFKRSIFHPKSWRTNFLSESDFRDLQEIHIRTIQK
jgi:hypothetical protein